MSPDTISALKLAAALWFTFGQAIGIIATLMMESWQSKPSKYTRLQAMVAAFLFIIFPVMGFIYIFLTLATIAIEKFVKSLKAAIGSKRRESIMAWLNTPLFRVKSTQQEHDEQFER